MTTKYQKQLNVYCKYFNSTVGKKDKLAEQDQFNQRTTYKGPTCAPTNIKSIIQADFKENQI